MKIGQDLTKLSSDQGGAFLGHSVVNITNFDNKPFRHHLLVLDTLKVQVGINQDKNTLFIGHVYAVAYISGLMKNSLNRKETAITQHIRPINFFSNLDRKFKQKLSIVL